MWSFVTWTKTSWSSRKPSGISTVRHPAEREWDEDRRELVPTLDDVTQHAIAKRLGTEEARVAATAHRPPARQGDERPGRLRSQRSRRTRTGPAVQGSHGRPPLHRDRARLGQAADVLDLAGPRPRRRPSRQRAGSDRRKAGRHARRCARAASRGTRSSSASSKPAARTRFAFTWRRPGHPVCGETGLQSPAGRDGDPGRERRPATRPARGRAGVRPPGDRTRRWSGRCRRRRTCSGSLERLRAG